MNHQLIDQTFAAINSAPIGDIKQWRKYIADAEEKLNTRVNVLADQQKKLLEDIVAIQKEVSPQTEAKSQKKPRATYSLTQDKVLAVVDVLLAEKTSVKLVDIYQRFISDGCDVSKNAIHNHLLRIVKSGQLVSKPDADSKLHFPTTLYYKAVSI